jgi:hypothetical protein
MVTRRRRLGTQWGATYYQVKVIVSKSLQNLAWAFRGNVVERTRLKGRTNVSQSVFEALFNVS